MKSSKIFDVYINVYKKGEAIKLPYNLVKYVTIDNDKYLNEYLKPYTDVDFKNEFILVMYLDPNRRAEKCDKIFKILDELSGISKKQIKGKSRDMHIVFSRQLFHWIFINNGIGNLVDAGIQTKNKHSTVLNSVKVINNTINVDNGWRKELINKLITVLAKEKLLKNIKHPCKYQE